MHDEMLQHLVHEQTSQLRKLNHQLQEEIRKRQLLEDKLLTSEAKMRAVFEAITDIILVINTQANQIKDIEIIPTSSSRLYESDTGLIDKTVKEFFQNKTANTWFQKAQEALDKKQALNFDYSLSIKGSEVWFSASISPISDKSVVWVARDITECKQAKEKKTALIHRLQQSERRLSQIVASVSESLIVQDKQNHQVLFVNAAATAFFDKPYEELIGESLGIPLISGELTELDIIHPSGKLLVAEMRTVDIIWENQAAYLITLRDVTERKIAEERLRLLERAIAASSNGIVMTDALASNNPVIYANSGFERITGYTKEEVIGKNCRFLQGTDKAQPGLEQLRRAIASGQETHVVLRNYRKDGTLFWNQFCITPVRDETGRLTHFIGIQTDITRRKQAEDALRKSEANLIAAQRVAHVGSWELNVLTKEISGSQEYFRILGFEPTQPELTYAQQCQRIHPDDRTRVHQTVEQIIATGSTYEIDFCLVRPDGQVRYVEGRGEAVVNKQGQVIKLFGTILDITERQQMEEKLRFSEKRYRQLFEGSVDGITLVNLQGRLLDCNASFQKMLGYSLEELKQKTFQEITPVQWHEREAQIVEQQILARGYSDTYEKEYIRKDGTVFPVEVTAYCLRNDPGQPELIWGIVRDITKRKLAEVALRESEAREREKAQALERANSELKHTQAQLIQAEKMSSLGQMIAGIAHEINNPTSFIYGNINPTMEYTQDLLHLIELYRQHYPEPVAEITEQLELIEPDFIADDFPKLLASMKEGAERISQIVLSLRNFSRLDESQSKRVDIHEGIDSTLLILKHRLKQQSKHPEIQVIKEYGQLPPVECYPGQLNQVFMNIISNAIDALDEATEKETSFEPTIRICTEVIKSDSNSSHSHEQNVSRVLIRIVDNSPSSIKAELLPKIFDPFFTTKPVGSGTGLGLSISYQIVVDRHRGQLRCYSTPGVGTEFAIELPIVQSATSQ